ncbi:MAG: hypothetical protein C0618_07615 [Desulfuromonas sp.]|nr:MAG: hypothetical protein C0618_07615 [Desulfuromonas sp.]
MIRILLLAVFSAALFGCAHQANMGNPEMPYPPAETPRVGDTIHLPTGLAASAETMYSHAQQAQIIYVGETHDNPASHQLQLEILAHLQEAAPGNISLAMEMFTPEQQAALDHWSNGELSEKEFIKDVQWYQNWQIDFDYYRPLLTFARDNRIPVIGLNAPKDLVRAIGRAPVDQQPEEILNRLPEFDFADPYQQAMTKAIYGDHPVSSPMKEGFLRIQTLWDETMAETLATYLSSDEGQGRQVMVIAGGNHVSYGFGIPRRVFRRLPVPYLLIGSRTIEIAEGKQVQTMRVDMPQFPMPPYDFMRYTRYENLPQQGVKLGVHLKEIDQAVTIVSVVPGSAAAHAGLQTDDILRQIDDTEITETFDLIYQLKQTHSDDRARLRIERSGATLQIEVDFATTESHP